MSKGLEIDYQQFNNLVASGIVPGMDDRRTFVSNAHDSVKDVINTNSIKGKAADNMKNYASEVLVNGIGKEIIQLIKNFEDMATRISLSYPQAVEDDQSLYLIADDYDSLTTKDKSQRGTTGQKFSDINSKIKALGALNVEVKNGPTEKESDTAYNQLTTDIDTQNNDWRTFESSQTDALKSLEYGINALEKLITKYTNAKAGDVAGYTAGAFAKIIAKDPKMKAYFDNLNKLSDKQLKQDVAANKKIYDQFEKEKWENRVAGVVGLALDAVGVWLLITTAPVSLPTALCFLAISPGAMFASADITEHLDMVINGKEEGDNPIKDGVFGGNEAAYDVAQVISTASLSEPVLSATKSSWNEFSKAAQFTLNSTKNSKSILSSLNSNTILTNMKRANSVIKREGFNAVSHYISPVTNAWKQETTKETMKKLGGKVLGNTFSESVARTLSGNNDNSHENKLLKNGSDQIIDTVFDKIADTTFERLGI